jgi:hypothetical protein
VLNVATPWASNRAQCVEAVNRCLTALKAGKAEAALTEFAALERGESDALTNLQRWQKEKALNALEAVEQVSTGHSEAVHNGMPILYLFGEIKTTQGQQHFTADFVQEKNDWKMVRLAINGLPGLGTRRIAYENVPRVNNAVNSMIAGETVLNEFLKAGESGDVVTALNCWVKAERERVGKADELKQLFAARPEMFKDVVRVEEGKTNFGFKNEGDNVVGVTANGNIAYRDGTMRRFKAELIRENGALRIVKLTF